MKKFISAHYGILFYSTILVLCGVRLFYCVDLTDEALYSALPVHLLKGGRLFFDELLPQQTAAILTEPLVSIYSHFRADFAGIVLFFRWTYLFFQLAISFLIVYFLLHFMDKNRSWLVASFFMAFVPFSIPSLSYNTLSSGFTLAGLLLLTLAYLDQNKWLIPFGIGGLVLATLAYPTLAAASAPVILIALAWQVKVHKFDAAVSLSFFVLIISAIFAIDLAILKGGLSQGPLILKYNQSFGYYPGIGQKILLVLSQLAHCLPWLLCFFVLATLCGSNYKKPGWTLFFLLIALIYFRHNSPGLFSHNLILAISLCSPLFFFFLKKQGLLSRNNQTLAWLALISLCYSIIYAVSSGNGMTNAPLGLIGATLVAIVFLETLNKRIITFFLIILSLSECLSFWEGHYGDDKISDLNQTISSGPFAGLRTSQEKADYINELQTDLQSLSQKGSIAFFDLSPGIGMMTSLSSKMPTLWTYFPNYIASNRQILADYYQKNGEPDIVVWLRRLPIHKNEWLLRDETYADPLKEQLFTSPMKSLIRRSNYEIFIKASAF